MIYETYLANVGEELEKNPEMKFIVVTKKVNHPLSPSWNLINDWKGGKINWEEYTRRYLNEIINNKESINSLYGIAGLSVSKDICLVCYEKRPPCHRFILLSLFKCLGYEISNSSYDDVTISDMIVKQVLDDKK